MTDVSGFPEQSNMPAACYDADKEEFQSICKIGTGFSEAVLEERSTSLGSRLLLIVMVSNIQQYYRVGDSLNPDVWFEPTEVWEVKAADLTISPVHRAATGIVDPDKGFLRFPRLPEKTRSQRMQHHQNRLLICTKLRNTTIQAMMPKVNSPSTCTVTLEVLGHKLNFAQDPNSKHLGTTVWDASMVFAKYLGKNCRKGRFSPSKLKGKRAIELGAGCGVAGFAMAMLGCDVVSTDQKEVLPLLKRNVEWNTSTILQMNPGSGFIIWIARVAELDWGNEDHIRAVERHLTMSSVYSEQLLEPLLHTILALSGPKTTVMLGYEIRSTIVHDKMLQMWKDNFEVKTIPRSKMDGEYQDPSIHLYLMSQKSSAESSGNAVQDEAAVVDAADETQCEKEVSTIECLVDSPNPLEEEDVGAHRPKLRR
ncbi:hypothetical protein Bca52824_034056 [Brassica carinata]|uniref:DNA ligase ATP-dependent C-terminal domain-containing protein n=1 Tax=Brassica carinata TaxID=52824 RepID=A0A8X7SF30_BRACI|nr:hypothetical protein Bca52824_034056 [Brassica carinata]